MNKKERVRAALAGLEVDRVPAAFWFHFPKDRNRGDAAVQAHLEFHRQSDNDFVKVMNEHPFDPGMPIRTAADWRSIRPATADAPFFRNLLDELKRIVDALGDDCFVITTIRNPLQVADTTGKLAQAHLRQDPAAVGDGFRAIAESLAAFGNACIDAGADGIYYSAKGGEEGRFSDEEFDQWIRPHDLHVLRAVEKRGTMNVLHICGEAIRLGRYASYPAHAVNWAVTKNALSMEEGRRLFGRTIIGGIDNRGSIVNGTPEQIRSDVEQVIESAGRRGTIVGADCTLPTDVDPHNVRIAVEATR
jgi:uroporphyrinogen decarboxylase